MNYKRLAIIPAKGKSKRIKNKNSKNFFGKPIIYYTLNNAIKSKLFNKIHVSSENKKILTISENLGIQTDFIRPKKLSRDSVILNDVLRYVVNKYKKKKIDFDEVWLLFPCAPLINENDLIKAKKKFDKTDKKYPMMSFVEYDAPIQWAFQKKKNYFIPGQKNKLLIDSKKLDKSFYESATFVIFKSDLIFKKKTYDKYYGYQLSKTKGIDIDEKIDWQIAEYFYKRNKLYKD